MVTGTIGDIMKGAQTRSRATFYREKCSVDSQMTCEMFCLMKGVAVHPSTLYPGGVGTVSLTV